ncbi:hypothetical protein MAR_027186 [Mya arenaria]|uniref:Uncharacterized protein n=1 Tax=Mya arenaria TaxID=6604 RepID=A0ABY7EW10_MYAAR|nr:hypothetical protein MAR_027186 [Mya arenaria]
MSDLEKTAYAFVLKMLATTASVTSLLPARYCQDFDQVISDCNDSESAQNIRFNSGMTEMRKYAPELHDLNGESINRSVDVSCNDSEEAVPQPGTYNPEKYGRAYYFNQSGSKVRDIRKFTTDEEMSIKRMLTMMMLLMTFSGATIFPPSSRNKYFLLWFCADHGHCYILPYDKGRRPSSFTVFTPDFHDIFHGYAHKCSVAFHSSRPRGFESINSEICDQFNSLLFSV